MEVHENFPLRTYNSFGIAATAKSFAKFSSTEELEMLFKDGSTRRGSRPPLILGGGSNMLFTRDYDGLVLKNEINGIGITAEDEDFFYVSAGAGENWHHFVMDCIANERAGVENLSLIPGKVGASPMQNIGAYGVEIKDVFHELTAYHLQDHVVVKFSAAQCKFGYRESVFKNSYRNQFAILTVTYKLRKQPVFNTSYGAISEELEKAGIKDLSIKAISDAVIRIRSAKLPDPAIVGNAGSFFKNPEVSEDKYAELLALYPKMPAYPVGNGRIKLAAGWLIEQCGWKGYRKGDAGCYPNQALVLVNYGNATGQDIYDLSSAIAASVNEKFAVVLEREVNIL